jgi:polyisoprenoid-binding protein YceI
MRCGFCLPMALILVSGRPVQAADVYRLDGSNTEISFDVRLFGFPWVSAHFREFSGELVPDQRAVPSRVDVVVRTASLHCENPRWNARLLSPTWFNSERYPQITYHSDWVQFDGNGKAIVSGELTLHGQTQRVDFEVRRWSCSNSTPAHAACSFDAQAYIKRSAYGLPHAPWEGGDEVEVSIHSVGTSPGG